MLNHDCKALLTITSHTMLSMHMAMFTCTDYLCCTVCCIVCSPIFFASPTTMLRTPGGMPARLPSSARARAVKGVASAGFRMTYTQTREAIPKGVHTSHCSKMGLWCHLQGIPEQYKNLCINGASLQHSTAANSSGFQKLETYWAANSNGRRDFACDHGHWEVPGCDGSHHSNRLLDHDRPVAGADSLKHITRHSPALLSKPFNGGCSACQKHALWTERGVQHTPFIVITIIVICI